VKDMRKQNKLIMGIGHKVSVYVCMRMSRCKYECIHKVSVYVCMRISRCISLFVYLIHSSIMSIGHKVGSISSMGNRSVKYRSEGRE
jgi:hypothetical protein